MSGRSLLLSSLLVATVLGATLLVAPRAHAQRAPVAFVWFQKFCLANAGKPDVSAALARQAGWKQLSFAEGAPVADLVAFQAEDTQGATLVLMNIPAESLDSTASARACFVGEAGADEHAMEAFLTDWTGFAPEDDGGFAFWPYRTVEGVRVQEPGLMADMPGGELVARVRERDVSLIGIMPGPFRLAFAKITPFL